MTDIINYPSFDGVVQYLFIRFAVEKTVPWFNYWFSFTLAYSRLAMSTRLLLLL